jgi:hypothetical protein
VKKIDGLIVFFREYKIKDERIQVGLLYKITSKGIKTPGGIIKAIFGW